MNIRTKKHVPDKIKSYKFQGCEFKLVISLVCVRGVCARTHSVCVRARGVCVCARVRVGCV